MTLEELKVAVLDELETVASIPIVDPEEIRRVIDRLFQEYADGQQAP